MSALEAVRGNPERRRERHERVAAPSHEAGPATAHASHGTERSPHVRDAHERTQATHASQHESDHSHESEHAAHPHDHDPETKLASMQRSGPFTNALGAFSMAFAGAWKMARPLGEGAYWIMDKTLTPVADWIGKRADAFVKRVPPFSWMWNLGKGKGGDHGHGHNAHDHGHGASAHGHGGHHHGGRHH